MAIALVVFPSEEAAEAGFFSGGGMWKEAHT
jgi:hypothetical protein